jgi:hypothetical protein
MQRLILILLVAAGLLPCAASVHAAPAQPPAHDSTVWDVQPSFKYDTLCFFNILSGDPFYLRYYKPVYEHFEPLMTPEVKAAIATIRKVIKDEGGGIISARLALYYSVVPAATLDQLIAVTRNVGPLKQALRKTEYFDADGWKQFDSVRPQLVTVFEFLERIHFHDYWQDKVRPGVAKHAAELERRLDRYNIIPVQEGILGHPLPSNRITVYLLHYVLPHGIRITGTRFLTGEPYPMRVVLMNAMHEMLHPPYDWKHDAVLRQSLEMLEGDKFLMQRVGHHNPSFGYNDFKGFVEEDVVQASDELVAERFDQAYDPFTRWQQSDDGMHVLAVALYELAHLEHYDLTRESMRDFIVRMAKAGKLAPGRIAPLYRRLYP